MSIPSYTVNKQYQNNKKLSEDQLDAAFGSGATWSSVVANKAPDKTDVDTITGPWTFSVGAMVLAGAGAGKVTLQYTNSASNRTVTFPDPGGSDSVSYLAATQTLTNKTLTSPTLAAPTISGAINGSFTLPSTDPPAANASTQQGLAKAWVTFNTAGTILGSYNVSSVVRNSAGNYTVSWNTDFSSTNYSVVGTPDNTATNSLCVTFSSKTVSSVQVNTFTVATTPTDANCSVTAFGNQ